jgi:Tol biopolymer transport system component
VPVNGGPARNITANNPAADETPLYSPDGKYIAYRAQKRPGYESDRWLLMLYERNTGTRQTLTDDFDRWLGAFAWATDSHRLYFVAEDKGEAPIYALDLLNEVIGAHAGEHLKINNPTVLAKPLEQRFNDNITVTANADRLGSLLFTRMSLESPNEIYRLKDVCF